MEPRRIILAQIPRFLREMLERALEKVPGIRIVDEVADLARLPAAIVQTGAQWVIVSLPSDGASAHMMERLLAAHPSIRLMNVVPDGSHVTMQWIEPHAQTLDEFSMGELIALLRDEPRDQLNVAPGG